MTSGHLDDRFSDPAAGAADWAAVEALLRLGELYWLTTVRADGRPRPDHVPLLSAAAGN